MKKSVILFFTIALFSVVISNLIATGLQCFAADVFSGQAYGKINHFLQVKDTCDFFVLGSSRANHHIDPTHFKSSSFNMGMDGRRFFFNEALFYLIPDSSFVLFHIDPDEFQDDAESMDRLIPHYGKNKVLDKALMTRGKITFLERLFGSLRFNNTFLALIGNKYLPAYNADHYHGYDPIYPSERDSLNLIREGRHRESKVSSTGKPINSEVIEGLARIKEHSLSAGINCVFFTSPVLHGLDGSDRFFMDSTFNELELAYVDCSNDIDSKDLRLWKDETHLSHFGAQAFSRKIFSRLLTPSAETQVGSN